MSHNSLIQNNYSIAFNKRYLAVCVLVYLLGTYIALDINLKNFSSVSLYSQMFAEMLLILTLLSFFILRHKAYKDIFIFAFLTSFIFSLGCIRTLYITNLYDTCRELIIAYPKFYGRIASELAYSTNGENYCFFVDVHKLVDNSNTIDLKSTFTVFVYTPVTAFENPPQINEFYKFSFASELGEPVKYIGGYDFLRTIRQEGVVTSVYSYNATLCTPDTTQGLEHIILFYSTNLRNLILNSSYLPAYTDNQNSLLGGILVGNKSGFSTDLYQSYIDSGFIHIISVSGMHTSYLFLIISFILKLTKAPRPIVSIVAIPLLWVFAAIASFTPSVCRACIMMTVLLLASLLKRNNDSITALSIAAFVLIFINPYSLNSYSLVLSFAATLGILIFYPLLFKHLSRFILKPTKSNRLIYKVNRFIINSICLSLSGTIGLSYFMAKFFGKLQWGGILGNILVFPLTAISFLCGYINVAIFYISPSLANLLALVFIKPSLWGINYLAELFSHPIFQFNIPTPSNSFFIIYVVICYALYLLLKPEPKNQSTSN